MEKRTPLYDCHVAANAKIVDFAGWQMPLHYGSQLQEHLVVREKSGMFDVSHMAVVDVNGPDAFDLLRFVFANDIAKLTDGKALYTCMLNEQGGVLDDMIVYRLTEHSYRIVLNASMREKDITWIEASAEGKDVSIIERIDMTILALQGPQANQKISEIFSGKELDAITTLRPFHFTEASDCFVARTGYTGEDGFEIILPAEKVVGFWQKLLDADVAPCGLGARDTLRLEAGLNLYGADMDDYITPLESNLTWTVAFEPEDRQFSGRDVLESMKLEGVATRLVGLVLDEGKGVLRNHQKVVVEKLGEGEITSGSFSPTLGCGVALARVPFATKIGQECQVEMRGKLVSVTVVKPPFVKFGKSECHIKEKKNESCA